MFLEVFFFCWREWYVHKKGKLWLTKLHLAKKSFHYSESRLLAEYPLEIWGDAWFYTSMLKDWIALGIVLLARIVLCPQEGNLLAYKNRQTYLEFPLRNANCLEKAACWRPVLGRWPKMHCQRPAHARSLPTKEIVHRKCKRLGISLWIQFLQKRGEELKLLGSSSSSNFRVAMGFLLALAELERVTCCLRPNQDKCLTSLTKSGCFSLASKVHLQKSPLFRTRL